jgi:hypothetical protein
LSLLTHAREAIAAPTDAVVVCGGSRPGIEALPDCPYRVIGPLGGLDAPVRHAQADNSDAVLRR